MLTHATAGILCVQVNKLIPFISLDQTLSKSLLSGYASSYLKQAQCEWVSALITHLFPHMSTRLVEEWARLEAAPCAAPPASHEEKNGSAEVLAERVLRELTREHLGIMQLLVAGGHGTGVFEVLQKILLVAFPPLIVCQHTFSAACSATCYFS